MLFCCTQREGGFIKYTPYSLIKIFIYNTHIRGDTNVKHYTFFVLVSEPYRKFPIDLLSLANSHPPCNTFILTGVCLSTAVEETSELEVGRVVLRIMILVITPPKVSIPRERGVTSRGTMSDNSPGNKSA